MTPAEFRIKWSKVKLGELQAYQPHFRDLCDLVGHPYPEVADPTGETFCFQRGASKQDGGEGWADVWKRGHFGIEYKGQGKDLDAAYKQLLQYREDLENPPLLVVSDLDRILIRTNFTGTRTALHEIRLETIEDPANLELLRWLFFEPEKLKPGAVSVSVTQEAAKRLGALAQALAQRGIPAPAVARFLDRLVFCFFAEDVGILPGRLVSELLDQARSEPELFPATSADLFQKMATGGRFGLQKIPFINGSLFDNAETLELTAAELAALHQISQLDWTHIDPSIFGTLFERGLDPAKRSQLGAHYTSREDIETLVEPVVMAPLRREWEVAKGTVESLLASGQKAGGPAPAKPLSAAAEKKARAEAWEFLDRFLTRLESVKVLDPACGSGNFLYVTLRKLKDLEIEVYGYLLDRGFQAPLRVGVGPWQLYGIEINEYAHGLAQLTVWIGYLQWLRQHGTTAWKEPILQAMSNIENKDAILDATDPANPQEPTWPKVDFIVSNPPFLGGKLLRRELGDAYVDRMFQLWTGRVPRECDLCCYWFEKTRSSIEEGRAARAGLLATQGIRGGANRKVLERIKQSGDIFWAWGDREWILDGAAVHVSMVGFDTDADSSRVLDGCSVAKINTDLTSGAATVSARPLQSNQGLSFMGDSKGGPFELALEEAVGVLLEPNPHGLPSSDVLVPWVNGLDLTRRDRSLFIVDFPLEMSEEEAAKYEKVYSLARGRVLPFRSGSRTTIGRWWLHERPRVDLREAIEGLSKYIATPRVTKHRLFVWLESPVLPDSQVIVIASEGPEALGVLHSRAHEVWALAQGTQLREKESGFRYTPTTCFETFPFPSMDASHTAAIAIAARKLDEQRCRWLNPPEWTKEEVLEFPGSVDGPWKRFVVEPDARGIGTVRWPRVVPKDSESSKKLAKRTLTNLYNERPAWLVNAHRKLDQAVFSAYGWPVDLTDEQILERLLALNLERAGVEAGG